MTACADYAEVYESDVRPRRRSLGRSAAAWALWSALLLIRPRLALQILRERKSR